MSNYPPGVSGGEWQITGAEPMDDDEETITSQRCANCLHEVEPAIRRATVRKIRRLLPAKSGGYGVPTYSAPLVDQALLAVEEGR